jgi:hypothetical protein
MFSCTIIECLLGFVKQKSEELFKKNCAEDFVPLDKGGWEITLNDLQKFLYFVLWFLAYLLGIG